MLAKLISKRFKGAATRTHDAPAPLQRFKADGLTHGRQRWKIEDVPARTVEGDTRAPASLQSLPPVDSSAVPQLPASLPPAATSPGCPLADCNCGGCTRCNGCLGEDAEGRRPGVEAGGCTCGDAFG